MARCRARSNGLTTSLHPCGRRTTFTQPRPAGRGPWLVVTHNRATRSCMDVDREHVRALARDGFLVMAPARHSAGSGCS